MGFWKKGKILIRKPPIQYLSFRFSNNLNVNTGLRIFESNSAKGFRLQAEDSTVKTKAAKMNYDWVSEKGPRGDCNNVQDSIRCCPTCMPGNRQARRYRQDRGGNQGREEGGGLLHLILG